MDLRHARFVRSALDTTESAELRRVDALAAELAAHLSTEP